MNKKKVRKILYFQQFKKCCWCNMEMLLEEATIEHIRAKADGGTDDLINLQVACAECNHARGARLLKAIEADNEAKRERFERERQAKQYRAKHRLPTSKLKRKLPRGRKRIFDRFPPARYCRQRMEDE